MKILWHGVPGEYPTGYGTQTKIFTAALRKAGHEVVISSVVSSCFGYTDQNGITVLGNGATSRMGNAMIREHVKRMNPDVLLTLFDTFVCEPAALEGAPWVAWSVIDSSPLHPRIHRISSVPKALWGMSRFGQVVMQQAGFECDFVPLAINPSEFHWSEKEKARAVLAKAWGRPVPKFLVAMVAANMSSPSRKNFHGAFRAWIHFLKSHNTKDAMLYVHTEHTGKMGAGENLGSVASMCGLEPGNLMFPDQYLYNQSRLGPDYLQTIYAAADVLLCTSLGEGFCLPLIEAQASGCPVIAPAATATKENVYVSTGELLTHLQPVSFQNGPTEWWLCNPMEVADKLATFYTAPVGAAERQNMSVKITGTFGIENVMKNHFDPALARAMATIQKATKAKKKGKAK